MKKAILTALMLITASMSVNAQVVMRVEMNDGSHVDYPVSSVKSVSWIENKSEIEAVDLGLSVKWANMNIGAASPEDYGWYLAWGETEPKDYYAWNTYFDSSFKKYFYDFRTALNPEDDAARVNWGGDWRMPTKSEMEELLNECVWTWTTRKGVNGYVVTSKKNSNSIFLPATGGRYDKDIDEVGEEAGYWSTMLVGPEWFDHIQDYKRDMSAYVIAFSEYSVDMNNWYRCYGHSVRAVCP